MKIDLPLAPVRPPGVYANTLLDLLEARKDFGAILDQLDPEQLAKVRKYLRQGFCKKEPAALEECCWRIDQIVNHPRVSVNYILWAELATFGGVFGLDHIWNVVYVPNYLALGGRIPLQRNRRRNFSQSFVDEAKAIVACCRQGRAQITNMGWERQEHMMARLEALCNLFTMDSLSQDQVIDFCTTYNLPNPLQITMSPLWGQEENRRLLGYSTLFSWLDFCGPTK